MGKPAVMLVLNSDTTAGTLKVNDVINHKKSCAAPPSLPASATKVTAKVNFVMGSENPKVITGTSLYELLGGKWVERKVFENTVKIDYRSFELSEARIWMLPDVWSTIGHPSKVLQYGLAWNGYPSPSDKRTWVDFAVVQV